jgi:arsenate reductase-like glutaredoxin family protein
MNNFKSWWQEFNKTEKISLRSEDLTWEGYKIRLVYESKGVTAMFLGRVQYDLRHTSVQFYESSKEAAIRKLVSWLKKNRIEPGRDDDYHKSEDKLSRDQLYRVRRKLSKLDGQKKTYSQKVDTLARTVPKLKEKWRSERVVRSEDKRSESLEVKNDAQELGFSRFKIMVSNRACKTCMSFTSNGSKIFDTKGLKKGGRDVPPIHSNCNCILIPYE